MQKKWYLVISVVLAVGCGTTETTVSEDTHSTSADTASGNLQWYTTCGDPVCSGHTADPNIAACTTETEGGRCSTQDASCDPTDTCNKRLLCTSSDPKAGTAGCPRSSRALKTRIQYLSAAEKSALAETLQSLPLARYHYKNAPEREQLGFIIEDIEPSPAIDPERNMVDLYGYLSMSVAAYQTQAAELTQVRKELAQMRADLELLRQGQCAPVHEAP